jgi:hypothetical protein
VIVRVPASIIFQRDLKKRGSTDDVGRPDWASPEGPKADVEAVKLVRERVVRVLEGECEEADWRMFQELDDVLTDDPAPVPLAWEAESVPAGRAHHPVAVGFIDLAAQERSEAAAVEGQDPSYGLTGGLEGLSNSTATLGPTRMAKDRGDLLGVFTAAFVDSWSALRSFGGMDSSRNRGAAGWVLTIDKGAWHGRGSVSPLLPCSGRGA